MNKLSVSRRAQILGLLVEGTSLRATSRLADCSINTVTKLLVDVGTACSDYQDKTLRNLPCKRVQVDEIWSFVYAKEKNVPYAKAAPRKAGDVWTWTAIDADTKLVPSWLVGTRSYSTGRMFIEDLASRMANRIQLTSDGYKAYLQAVDKVFGEEIDFAMLVKLYGPSEGATKQERRYSSGKCCGTITGAVSGDPEPAHISTSFSERQNLTMRMSCRRFTRLTNAFSKKAENLAHAVSLHFMHYNFGRVHKTLRMTPAMAAGVSDHVWSLEEIAGLSN